jgi:hypothetical protein
MKRAEGGENFLFRFRIVFVLLSVLMFGHPVFGKDNKAIYYYLSILGSVCLGSPDLLLMLFNCCGSIVLAIISSTRAYYWLYVSAGRTYVT